ncbi:MAG TPA: ankyrin repeat domain-containing protein, partial [Thermoanaerobaculia bacterium]
VLSLAAAALLGLPALMAFLPSRDLAVLPALSSPSAAPREALTPWPPLPAGEGENSRVEWRRPSPGDGRGVGGEGLAASPATVFSLLPLAISALLLMRLFLAVQRLSGLYDGSLPAPAEWLQIVDENRRRLGISRPVRLGVSSAIAVPVTFGWLRPVVLMPLAADRWGDEQLREALLHELAHVRRCDWPVQMIARAVCALHWFDPLVWLLRRRLLLEAELACDDQVLRAGTGAEGYAERLVALAREVRSAARRPATAVAFARSSGLASRVSAILDPGRRRGGPSRLIVAGTLLAALALLLIVAPARFVRAEPRSGETPSLTATSPFPIRSLPPLLLAAWEGDEEEVSRLLAAGADPNQAVPRLGTPLILAASQGHEDVVAVLLRAGADAARAETAGERPGDLQRTPLGAAARKGDLDVVRLLLAAGAPVDLAPRGDATPLMNAADRGHLSVVQALLDAGADPNAVVVGDGTPLIAAARGGDPEVVRRLLAVGANPNVYVALDGTALRQAIEHGNAEAARVLLDASAASLPEEERERSVREGVRGGVEGGVTGGVEGGVRGGVRGALEETDDDHDEDWIESITDGIEEGKRESLVEAAAEGAMEAVRVLLRAGADPNSFVPGDGTPLIAASRAGHADVVRLLLAAGADVDKVVPGDENPLIQAAWHGRLEVVRLLLEAGANPNVGVNANRSPEDPGGELRTPLRMARKAGHRDVEQLLLEHGARR